MQTGFLDDCLCMRHLLQEKSINCYLGKSTAIKSSNNRSRVKEEVEWQLGMNMISEEAIKGRFCSSGGE